MMKTAIYFVVLIVLCGSAVLAQSDDDSIWQPAPGTTWQWQLYGAVNTSWDVEMYDIDLFDVPQEIIDTLHEDGRIVICYFSAGSWEDWRGDAGDFPNAVLGETMEGWEDERNLASPQMRYRIAGRKMEAAAGSIDTEFIMSVLMSHDLDPADTEPRPDNFRDVKKKKATPVVRQHSSHSFAIRCFPSSTCPFPLTNGRPRNTSSFLHPPSPMLS